MGLALFTSRIKLILKLLKTLFMEVCMKFSSTIIAVSLCTGMVFAQAATTTTTTTTTKPAAAAVKADLKISGIVVSVDAVANTLTIKSGKKDETVSVTAETKIMSAGKTITLADLKADEKVVVGYKTEEGKMVADHIKVVPAAAAKKAETAPATK
jgi:hypothetical protein